MRTICILAGAIVTAAIMASASSPYAQETKLPVPNVTVTAPVAPAEPPYLRDPWKSYQRNPYAGRYRVEEDKFVEVPCNVTRIASAAGGVCRATGWCRVRSCCTSRAASDVTWRSTWLSTLPATFQSKPVH